MATKGQAFYDVTWGNVRLWCSRITTDNSRTQVVHEVAEGDEHPVQDRGLGPRRVTCELLWIEMPRESTTPKARFLAFKSLVDNGEGPLLFVHPIDGAYYANVEGFSYSIDEDDNIVDCSCVFIKTANAEAPVELGSGTSIAAGADAIATRATDLDDALEAVELETTIGDDAIAAQDAWAAEDIVPTRQVIVDVAGLSHELESLIVDNGLEDDLALFDAYKAAIMMGESIRRAGLAALADTPKLTQVLIREPMSLLAFCVRTYGGLEAQDRMRQISALNDLRTPGWLRAGLVVVIPVPRSKLRRLLAA